MVDYINVYLITGFLGSGKTTFLNRLIHQFPKDRKLMILMNEFGEIGVDGTLVDAQDLDILEISKGSIFCACVKTDFIKGLFEITQKIRPEVLLIESTGVANPTDLKKDLGLPIFNQSFIMREQFCIVDAAHFLDQFGVFSSVENQIASSTKFIINKIDLVSPEQIQEIKLIIKEHHPDPYFYETTFADINVVNLLEIEPSFAKKAAAASPPMTGDELESYVEELLNDPEASLAPPDILMSATFFWKGGDLSLIEEMTRQLPRDVPRAKGFLAVGKVNYLYNYIMGQYSLEEQVAAIKDNQKNVLVFISSPDVMPLVEGVMEKYNFIKTGELVRGY